LNNKVVNLCIYCGETLKLEDLQKIFDTEVP